MSLKTPTSDVELPGSNSRPDSKPDPKPQSDNRVTASPVSSIGADLRATAGNHGIYRETCHYLFPALDMRQAEQTVEAHLDQACINHEENPGFFIITQSPDVPNHVWLFKKKHNEHETEKRKIGYTLEEKTWIQNPHYSAADQGNYPSLKEICEFWEKEGYKGIKNKTPFQLECSPIGYQAKSSTKLDPAKLDHYFNLTKEQSAELLKEAGHGFAFLQPRSDKGDLLLVYKQHDEKVIRAHLWAEKDNNWDGPIYRAYSDVGMHYQPIYKSLSNACALIMDGQNITWLTKDNIQKHAPKFAERWPKLVAKIDNSSKCLIQ